MFEPIETKITQKNVEDILDVLKTHKPNNEPMLAGCRNCGDMFEVTFSKQKCNCGNVDFSRYVGDGGKKKQDKAMQKIRSWNQNKKNGKRRN
jgi:hypothetical protein